jgi:site-specific DNA recombinase
MNKAASKTPPAIRCAIYTRKSTEEGLDQAFNSLDAQRDSGEAYIASQKSEGWACLPDQYDDGGFTGGNMDRPALKRLLADIEGGKIDCIVVYKVDRLSRSLIDFAKIMEILERNKVSFVSVTQQFNTSTSMGRLMLNVLLSFAQFEREMISERTRDKIAATRRKGKWSGGFPQLGYDVDNRAMRLLVNEEEAARVREIFELYLDRQSLIVTCKILNERGWTTKRWTTRDGRDMGGKAFTKSSLLRLLTNRIYLGKITYKEEIHPGEHLAIVNEEIFAKANALLKHNGRTGGAHVHNKYGALLKGLVHCVACNCMMTATNTSKRLDDNTLKVYRYYACTNAQQRGWHICPAPSVPGPELERFVVDQIRDIGKDPALVAEVLGDGRRQRETAIGRLEIEKRALERELRQCGMEQRKLAGMNGIGADRMADVQERIRTAEKRATELQEQIIALTCELLSAREVGEACAMFDPTWATLTPREQARILHLLVERVHYDGPAGKVAITFRPTGIKSLHEELKEQETAA